MSVSFKEKIDPDNLPAHIAVIMDGNGRWARKRGQIRVFGHENGVHSVREVTETCAELGVKYLTLYAFSTENWNRPRFEVNALMQLLVKTIRKETKTLMENKIRLESIGEMDKLPSSCRRELLECKEMTKNNDRMTLILALSYSAKWDILNAVKHIAEDYKNGKLSEADINEKLMNNYLTTGRFPHPELLIRTSGEHRVSNFLLWEIAYSEFYFTNTLWPDFKKEDLYKAIVDYQQRERRFGKTSEQIAEVNP